jgi:hypothetical protein
MTSRSTIPSSTGSTRLGEATSTTAAYRSAIAVFDKYQRQVVNDPPLHELVKDDLMGDHLACLLTDFGLYLSHASVPKERGKGFISADTKTQYFGKIKESLKAIDATNSYWNDPQDWKDMRNEFLKAATRHNMSSGDGADGNSRCYPLYADLECTGEKMVRSIDIDANIVDLKFILRSLLKRAITPGLGLYQKRLELNLVFQAVGRGGEHYLLLRWDDARWDPRFQVPNFSWPILKQLTKQCMFFCKPQILQAILRVGYLPQLWRVLHGRARATQWSISFVSQEVCISPTAWKTEGAGCEGYYKRDSLRDTRQRSEDAVFLSI